ncbi:hypothetical protein M9H77_13175 [Catharanthus roseus]|uniref:Uncharacterized protein n=1 Tax=Catharanthus roseus TaxID=4058 RepID=A0ACC0BJF7_CATRO|nr:hypothetical protein M9H77_13175 [Catharanthus roseus]
MTEHITVVTQMVFDEPSMLYTIVNDDDDEVDQSNGDDAVSSQSESDDDNDPEEGELQTPVNLVNPVNPLGMRFVDKVQAINAVHKWSISVGREYKVVKNGFPYCRPMISVDGTYLMGAYKGILLIASTWDADNHLLPLSFAIID